MKRFAMAAALLAAIVTTAAHAEWAPSGVTTSDGNPILLEGARALPDNHATAWVSMPKAERTRMLSFVYRTEVRCTDYATAQRSALTVYAGGHGISPEVVATEPLNPYSPFKDTVPGSVMRGVAEVICTGR